MSNAGTHRIWWRSTCQFHLCLDFDSIPWPKQYFETLKHLSNGLKYLSNGFKYLSNTWPKPYFETPKHPSNGLKHLSNGFKYLSKGPKNLSNGPNYVPKDNPQIVMESTIDAEIDVVEPGKTVEYTLQFQKDKEE
jgi:hypothetical protein